MFLIRHVQNAEMFRCIGYRKIRIMFMSKVLINKTAYRELLNHVHKTGFRYETGGLLLGYKVFRMFFVAAVTSQKFSKNMKRMTFILNGKEHTEKMQRIRKSVKIQPQLIGIWHSHTTDDDSLSLQDRKSNQLLAKQFGKIISVIITQKKEQVGVRVASYHISHNNRTSLCKVYIIGDSR